MKVLSAEFVTSAAAGRPEPSRGAAPAGRPLLAGIPQDGLPQVAMVGRSNVGKSTLINALGRKKIARTSAAPGKTRLANVYRLTLEAGSRRWGLYLVDLPGYGYARGGADAASELKSVADAYFSTPPPGQPAGRPGATDVARHGRMALLLVDARHPGLDADRQAAQWLASMNIDFRIVATKMDKLSRTERARNLKALEVTFGMPPLPVAAASGEGLDELWKTIASLVRTGHA